MERLVPLSERSDEGWAVCRQGLTEIAGGRFPIDAWLARMRTDLDRGDSGGALVVEGRTIQGVAVWNRTPVPDRRVRLLYLHSGVRSIPAYRGLLEAAIEQFASEGPVAFCTGDLLDLDPAGRAAVMEPLGFRRFTRSEMRFPDTSSIPVIRPKPGTEVRRVRVADAGPLARLHRLAYADRFDRYLFMEDPDPGRDSTFGMEKLLRGGWGPFLSADSFVAERSGSLVGASLIVEMDGGPLLADAMVDPSARGQGIAAAVIAASLRSLRDRSAGPLRLNVTGGNLRAERLYRSLGFVATFTDSGWYAPQWVPIPPEGE